MISSIQPRFNHQSDKSTNKLSNSMTDSIQKTLVLTPKFSALIFYIFEALDSTSKHNLLGI